MSYLDISVLNWSCRRQASGCCNIAYRTRESKTCQGRRYSSFFRWKKDRKCQSCHAASPTHTTKEMMLNLATLSFVASAHSQFVRSRHVSDACSGTRLLMEAYR